MMKVGKIGLVAAAFAVSSMLVAGCGGKTADRAPAPGAWQGAGDKQDVITLTNFDSIQPGASIGDVEALYGKKGELIHQSIVNGVYTSTYRWQDGPYKIVDCTFTHENRLNHPISCNQLVRKELRATDEIAEDVNTPVTQAKYNALAYGMNLAAAKQALGMDGVQLGEDVRPGIETKTYGWAVANGLVARLTFQDDKLIAMNLDNALPAYRIVK